MSDASIGRDLKRKLQNAIEPILERELALAQLMLDRSEVARLAIEVGAAIASAMIAVPVQMVREDTRAEFFDMTVETVMKMIRDQRDGILREIAEGQRRQQASVS